LFQALCLFKTCETFFGIISNDIHHGKGHEFTGWQIQFHARQNLNLFDMNINNAMVVWQK